MPTSTRSSNKKTNFKAYCSKKIPKQTHFAHRRKLVRRPDVDDALEKRQMTFLAAGLKRRGTVQDSEGEGVENLDLDIDEDEGGVAIGVESEQVDGQQDKTRAKQRRKRTSDVVQEDEEPVKSNPKRRKKTQKKQPKSEAKDSASPASSEFEQDQKRRRKRQSTMTQIVDGRRPGPESKEPQFKPTKKAARRSWSGKGGNKLEKDAKQRTLTQMMPGMNTSFEIYSDSRENGEGTDTEAEKRESQAYDVALTQRLIAQGLLQPVDDGGVEVGVDDVQEQLCAEITMEHEDDQDGDAKGSPPLADVDDDVTEDEYLPTQFVEAPVTKTPRTSRRLFDREQHSSQPKAKKSRFGLLSTPERRRVREIPSSQSPAESLISIQHTPHRSGQSIRSPLTRRSDNTFATAVVETPSKRSKQVTFQEVDKEQHPPRPTLRRFASTILDSEDEDDDGFEIEDANIGAETQALIRRMDGSPAKGVDIGEETQAALKLIDRACADIEDGEASGREMEERDVSMAESRPSPQLRGKQSTTVHEQVEQLRKTPSPHQKTTHTIKEESLDSPTISTTSPLRTPPRVQKATTPSHTTPSPPYSTARTYIKCELLVPSTPPSHQPLQNERLEITGPRAKMYQDSPLQAQETPSKHHRTQLQDTYPSSPMFINDSENEDSEEESPAPTPPLNPASQNNTPREQESQLSNLDSLAADHQLRSEHASYSQFHLPLPPPPPPPLFPSTSGATATAAPFPSSMFVAPESAPLYQHSPFSAKKQANFQQLSRSEFDGKDGDGAASQATTVDPTQFLESQSQSQSQKLEHAPSENENEDADTDGNDIPLVPNTPHSHSHSLEKNIFESPSSSSSPTRPPPLLIPSSFPSPSNAIHQISPHAHIDDTDEDNDQDYTPTISRGDGVGASGLGKGYTQWLASRDADGDGDGDGDGNEDEDEDEDEDGMHSDTYGYGYESYEDFSIPAPPPVD